jgi:8-oxo-dGTP diphosphatase
VYLTNNHRFEFVDFIKIREEEIGTFQPLAGSYAVVKCNHKFLLCYNTWRKQWELPAGKREENETPKECAIRELYEETGQIAATLDFQGLLKVKDLVNGSSKYNPVYFTALKELQNFRKNGETSAIKLWDLRENIGCIDQIDVKIFEYIR